MSQNLHQKLVKLRGWVTAWINDEDVEEFDPTFGICINLELTEDEQDLLADLMALWPDSSGDRNYPVPHPTTDAEYAYHNASSQENWNPEREYARNRWALLEWLIEQIASEADQ